MRCLLKTTLGGLLLFGLVATYSQLVANSRFLARSRDTLRLWAQLGPQPDPFTRGALVSDVVQRAKIYEAEIERTHLVDGMLVNRTVSGATHDTCDSLLFSSLRFVALGKLGLEAEADDAWNALQKSQTAGGDWVRHPRCAAKATSRDMIWGLLIALSQQPEGGKAHLRKLIDRIAKNDGYFSSGPRYVSYLTPNLAKMMRIVALSADIPPDALPPIVREGYSTGELSLIWIKPGFEAHLVGLSIWLELEIQKRFPHLSGESKAPWFRDFAEVAAWATPENAERQRLQWAATRLVDLDPGNLFYRYLRLRTADALTQKTAATLITELQAMPQFPVGQLPRDCDRRADYLWQREPSEHLGARGRCHAVYNGTDYLWLAGLLVEAMGPAPAYTQSH